MAWSLPFSALKRQDRFGSNKNYYLRGNLAYTEDNILIHNLFVYNIPRQISQDDLKLYFSTFGEIQKMLLIEDKKPQRRSANRVGCVHFRDPMTAAKVLQFRNHMIGPKRFCVKACDSWRQPEKKHSNKTEATDLANKTAEIMLLNDDCLMHICKKLGPRDQVSFARSCNRFSNILVLCARKEHKVFALDHLNPMTLWEQKEFITLIGPQIEVIIGQMPYKNSERIIEFICYSCPNVKSLNLDSSRLKNWSIIRLSTHLLTLTELELHDCGLIDSSINNIRKLPKLTKLSLSENYDLTGKHLSKLKTVEDLNLSHCSNVQAFYLIEMIKTLVDLRKLNLQGCCRVTMAVFQRMAQHSKKLEALKISIDFDGWEILANLPALKSLELIASGNGWFSRPLAFDGLIKHKADQLESLKIVSRNTISSGSAAKLACLKKLKVLVCNNNECLDDTCLRHFSELEHLEELSIGNSRTITNYALLSLLKKCKNLRRLNIQGCVKIDNNFIEKAIVLLNKTKMERLLPMTFMVVGSGITESCMETPAYLQAANDDILTISFRLPATMQEQLDLINDDDLSDDGDIYLSDDDFLDGYEVFSSDDEEFDYGGLDVALMMMMGDMLWIPG